jgi:hypothetical protein
MGKAKRKDSDPWQILRTLIWEYGQASRADEMKGGGDPDQMDIIELECELAQRRLESHIRAMEREFA